MKDFTTSAYITPVIDQIEHTYFIDRAPAEVKAIFKCDLILTPALYKSPDRYLISKDRENLLPNISEFKNIFTQIDQYTAAAETYAGELDQWSSREKDEVIKAVYITLIDKYL